MPAPAYYATELFRL